MEIIIIRWTDSTLHGQETKWNDDLKDCTLITLISAGILVKEDDTSITLCLDYNPSAPSWRSLASYSKKCIEIVKRVKVPTSVAGKIA